MKRRVRVHAYFRRMEGQHRKQRVAAYWRQLSPRKKAPSGLYRRKTVIPKSPERLELERSENRGEFRYVVRLSFTRLRARTGEVGKARYRKIEGDVFQTLITHRHQLIERRTVYFRTKDEVDRWLASQEKAFLKKSAVTVDATVQLIHGRVINPYKATLAKGAQATKQYRAFGISKFTTDKKTKKTRRRNLKDVASDVQNAFRDVSDEVYSLREDGFSTIEHKKAKKMKKEKAVKTEEPKDEGIRERRARLSKAKRADEERRLMAGFRAAERRRK